MDYGATFKKLRLEKGITLKEACQQGISSAQLSRFENGKSMLTVDQFLHACKISM
ncbi:helix-turn-helix domain-containing protein [Enterococcus gallinarum]|nr:helix-turn-helix domain-containing protein [Enterococcus gallinarum]MCW3745429.1 helix-turn-helix domain-containing protein [Enterococcus gallinarum]